MPNINAKGAGDSFYPEYEIVTTEPVSAIALTKGRLYTKGSAAATANQLVAAGTTGFINGLYQATRTISTAGAAGANTVQCYGPGSRIGLPAKTANLHAGQLVKYDTTNHNVELFTGSATFTVTEYASKIGRILEIYTKTSINTPKQVTAIGDIVIVELARG